MKKQSIAEQFNAATAAYQAGDLVRAQQLYHEILKEAPDHAESHYNLAAIYIQQNTWLAAIEHYKSALKIYPQASPILYNLSAALVRTEQFGQAVFYLEKLLEQDPQHAQAHYLLAVVLLGSHQIDRAEPHFLEALKYLNADPELHQNLGILYLHRQDYTKAKRHFLESLQLKHNVPEVLFNLAKIASYEKKPQQAIDYLLKSLEINPDYFDAHYDLALLYKSQSDYPLALKHTNFGLKLCPDDASLQFIHKILTQKETIDKAPDNYVRTLFDQYAVTYEEHLKKLGYHLPQFIYDQALPYLKPQSYRILDLGCGTGLSGIYWRNRASYLVGVDISSQMINQAKQKKIYDDLFIEDFITFFKKPNTFDLILAADVWGYWGKLTEIFTQIHDHLSANGLFIFSTEKSEHYPFILQITGRFSHHSHYVEEQLNEQLFTILHRENVVLRQQNDENVNGELWIAEKKR